MAEQQEPTPVATPATPAASLAAQYEFGDDTVETPQLLPNPKASAPEKPKAAPVVEEDVEEEVVAPATPERGQDGRFVPARQEYSPTSVQLARDFGLADAEILDHTPAELDKVVLQLSKATRKPAEAKVVEAEPEIDHDDLPPALSAWIKKQEAHSKAQQAKIDAQQAKLDALDQAEGQRQAETVNQTMDRMFGEREDVFGKGNFKTVKRDSKEYKRRIAVAKLAGGDNSNRSLEEKVAEAIDTLYGESEAPVAPSAPAKPNGKPSYADALQERRNKFLNGGLAKPTDRQGAKEMPGKAKAIKSVEKIFSDASLNTDDETSLDDFPE